MLLNSCEITCPRGFYARTHGHCCSWKPMIIWERFSKQIYYNKNDVHSSLKWKRHKRYEHKYTVVKLTRSARLYFIICGLCVSYKTLPYEVYTLRTYNTNCGKPPWTDTTTTENVALGNVFQNTFLVFNNNVNMVSYWCNTCLVTQC